MSRPPPEDSRMQLHVGTSGYSYKEWKGPFYPEKLRPADMLRFYAERLPAVEINNTFYRLPKASVLESWASQVPAGFRFAIKASRRITHFKRLKEAGDETDYLLRTTATLGERLGPRPLDRIAQGVGASKRTLERIFRAETGVTFGQWRKQLRLLEALRQLAAGEPVTNVALRVGYESPSAFIAMFRNALGTTPSRYYGRAAIKA